MCDPICTKFRSNGILFVVNRGNNAATPNLFCRLLLFFRVCKNCCKAICRGEHVGSHLHEVSFKRDPFCSKSKKQRSDSKLVLSSSIIFQSLQKIVAKRSAEENMCDPICTKFRSNGILFVVNRGNNAATPNLFCRLLLFFRVCEK